MDAPTPAWTPPQTSSRRSVSFANSLNHESYALQDFRLGGSVPSSVFSSTQSSPSSQSSSPTLTTSPLLEEEELVRRVKNGRHASASSTFTALSATTTTFTTDGLLSLPPPKPYDVVIDNLTIGVPVSKRSTLRDRLSELAGRATGRGKYGELGKSRQHVESVAGGAKEEAIVRSAGGRCNAGEVLALMGGSGSGKTTLLNAIANRLGDLPVLSGKVSFEESTGDTSASSSPLSPSSRASKKKLRKKVKTQRKMVGKVMGFVQQSDDHLLPYLTCRETLAFAADLRLPRSTTKEERRSIVEQTLAELGLTDVAETMVGGALRKGISGGQRRRLSIGCVLVTLPSVLLLDEPTTGLDATSGIALLQTLSQLARRNRTIILSVHSPRSEAFILFDRIILLSRGDVAYSGKSSNMIGWFERFSGRRLPQGVNPLDFVVDCTSVDYRDPKSEASSRARVTSLLAHWKSSPVEDDPFTPLSTNRRSQARMSTYTLSQPTDDSANETYDKRRPSQLAQTAILLRRSHLNVYRDVPQLAGLLGQAIVLGLFLGFNMFQIGESPADVQTVKNATYTQITQYLYLSAVFWVWKATTSLRVFDRERADRLYGVAPYVLSDFVSFLVPSVISSILFSVLLFCLAGLRRDTYVSSLVTFAGTCVLSQFVLQGLALVSAALFRDFAMASLFSNAISMFRALSSGFLVVHVPAYLKWIKWTSQTYFGFRILAGSLLKDRSFDCPGVEGDALAQCDGNKVLVGMDLRSDGPSSGIWFAALAALFVVQYALAIVILQFYHPGRQKAAGAVKPKKPSTSKSTVSMPVAREEITVELKDLNLQWTKRAIGPLSKGASKTILDRVSCTFTPGDVNVIMGPSGSGKSTIEQILSHRQLRAGPLASFAMEGSLTFNGHPAGKKTQHLVGFVGQEDGHHFPGLSVRETVLFAAHLKLRHLSKRERVARAEEVLSILGLSLCADNLVGGPLLKGISGGEKRRLSIAVVLLSDPSVMILDEPTSGLDSFTAASVMEVLKDIAQSGRMVIASIHQPRTEVFEKFDNLCTLAKGGRVVYAGPADKATSWFVEEQGCLPAFDVNPADWLLDLISEDSDKDAFFESTSRVAALVDAWNSRTSDKNSYGLAPSLLTAGPLPDPPKTSKGPSLVLIPVLVRRMIKNLVRSRAILHRPLQAPFISLLLLLFFQKLSDGASGAQDRIGWAIQCVSTTPFLGLVVGVATFSIDRDLFYHEYEGSKAYSATTFLLSYTAVETPMTALAALLFGCIMNLAIGAETSVSIFFQFVTAIFSCLSFGESVAVISSTLVRDMGVATTTVPTLLAMAVQLSGLLSLSTPGALEIISWATPLRVATKVIFINELNNGLVFDCSPESVASGECVSKTGSALLSRFELHDLNTTKFCFVSLATVLGWRLLAFVLLEIRMRLR